MGNVKKTKTATVPTKTGGSYKYSYTDLAAINDYLEENGLTYDQYTESQETSEGKKCDYIMTQRYRVKDDKTLEEWGKPMRGLPIQYANETPQQLGSRITYLRRYSLLMAFGLAAEDNDAQGLPPVPAGPMTPPTEKPVACKVDFNEVRSTVAELDSVADLEDYWLSLGKLSEGQAKVLQGIFARRKKELQKPEAPDVVE